MVGHVSHVRAGKFEFSNELKEALTGFFKGTAFEGTMQTAINRSLYAQVEGKLASLAAEYRDGGNPEHPGYKKFHDGAKTLRGRCIVEFEAWEREHAGRERA